MPLLPPDRSTAGAERGPGRYFSVPSERDVDEMKATAAAAGFEHVSTLVEAEFRRLLDEREAA